MPGRSPGTAVVVAQLRAAGMVATTHCAGMPLQVPAQVVKPSMDAHLRNAGVVATTRCEGMPPQVPAQVVKPVMAAQRRSQGVVATNCGWTQAQP
jgi:hypothetical protein